MWVSEFNNIIKLNEYVNFSGKMRVDGHPEVTVAIKVLKDSATPENEDDFMREVEIIASFQHPNILSLLGFVGKGIFCINAIFWLFVCPFLRCDHFQN